MPSAATKAAPPAPCFVVQENEAGLDVLEFPVTREKDELLVLERSCGALGDKTRFTPGTPLFTTMKGQRTRKSAINAYLECKTKELEECKDQVEQIRRRIAVAKALRKA
jgi:hypothetical protein